MIRGFGLHDLHDFQAFYQGLHYCKVKYAGGTGLRKELIPGVSAASADPGEFSIEPHQELSFSQLYPDLVAFFCVQPADAGGEGVLTDMRAVGGAIPPRLRQRLEAVGVEYETFYESDTAKTEGPMRRIFGPSYQGWQSRSLGGTTREAVETHLRSQQASGWEWGAHDDSLLYRLTLPAFREHPLTKEAVPFFQCGSQHASFYDVYPGFLEQLPEGYPAPNTCRWGDGTEFQPGDIATLRALFWQHSVAVQYQAGDLLLFDNLLVGHGRLSFTSQRVLASGLFIRDLHSSHARFAHAPQAYQHPPSPTIATTATAHKQ